MTADHPVRRLLARFCSAETMARVVDPTLADVRVEDGRLTGRGLVALARALTVLAIVSLPASCSRLYHDDQRALPRGIALGILATLVLAAPLVAIPAKSVARISWYAVFLLVPQALAMALPMSLLAAIPLAFRRTSPPRRLVARGLILSALCAAATGLVMIQALPDANQAFRVEVVKRFDPAAAHVPRGPIEMTLQELREQIEVLRLTPGGEVEARRLEYTLQMKLAMSAISLPLGLLAIAITIAARGRVVSIAIGIGAAILYVYALFAADTWTLQWLRRSDAISPGVLAWAPATLIGALALAILWRSRLRVAAPCV